MQPGGRGPVEAGRGGFHGRTVVVIGASRGIGAAAAEAFARAGAHTVVASRDSSALDGVVARITATGGSARAAPLDVGDPDAVAAVFAQVDQRDPPLAAAFNNAGDAGTPRPFEEIDPVAFDRMMRVTVYGGFYALRAELPRLAAAGGGAVVNMASTAARMAYAGGAPYVAAKHAVVGLTRAAAVEFAARGVRVNAVAPGPIDSTRLRAAPEAAREQTVRAVPMRRLGTVDEVASAVVWLASSASSFVTGATLFIDGGRMAGFA